MPQLLIDGNNWFAQCYYANSTNAITNMMRRLQTVLEQIEHSRIYVCWDFGTSFRVNISARYKAHRSAKGDEYHSRLRKTQDAVASHTGLIGIGRETFEADDCIATLVRNCHDLGEQAIVFSADKDLHQLLSAGTVSQVVDLRRVTANRLTFTTVTAERLLDKYGVRPDQWVDYRAIVGDSSDGIAGCKGLGESVAREVLQKCGTLDAFYLKPFAPRISDRQRTLLMNYRPELPKTRQLLQLVEDLPILSPVGDAA